MINYTIIVTAQFDGIHCWPEAPREVAFLRSPHRHLFKVAAKFGVDHNDRQLEFFSVQKELEFELSMIKRMLLQTQRMSCEIMAGKLLESFRKRGFNCLAVTISEDGENAGTAEWVE